MRRTLLAILLLMAAVAQGGRFLGTFPEDAEVVFLWNTYDDDGASVTRATDGTVKVYRDDKTDCTGTSVDDEEDEVDTGIHRCAIDTSDGANYAPGYTYFVWIDGAVIDGDTVNAVIASFSIEDRFVNIAEIESVDASNYIEGRTLAAADYFLFGSDEVANVTAVGTTTTCTTLSNWEKTGYSVSATGLDAVLKSSTFGLAMADAVWDEALTGNTHNVATSAGRRLRSLEAAQILSSGTAQGGTATTIQLAATEGVANDWYNSTRIIITEGTGAGQSRHIHDYDGDTDTCTTAPAWITNPGADSVYEIYAQCQQDLDSYTLSDIWAVGTRSLTILDEDTTTIDLDGSTVGGLTTWSKTGYTLTNLSDANAAKLEDMLDGTGATLTLDNYASFKATGFSTHTAANVVTAFGTGSTLTDCATATGFSTLDAAGVRSAIGIASANIDTQIGAIPTNTEFALRTRLTADYFSWATDTVANVGTVATLTGHTVQTGDTYELANHGTYGFSALQALSADIPTTAEFEARTKAEADYYTPTDDLALLQSTTIATLATQTSFTLAAGSTDDNAYNDQLAILVDQTTGAQKSVRMISDYTGATRTVTLESAPAFTIAVGDTVRILVVKETVVEAGP